MINRTETTITRPNNTTAYDAGDCIGSGGADSCFEIGKAAANSGGSGYIIGAQLLTDSSTTTGANFRLWLFNSAIIASADNTAFDLLYTDNAEKKLIGYIDFTLETTGQGNNLKAVQILNNVNMAFKAADQSLYGVLTTTAAHTPKATGKFYINLLIDQF